MENSTENSEKLLSLLSQIRNLVGEFDASAIFKTIENARLEESNRNAGDIVGELSAVSTLSASPASPVVRSTTVRGSNKPFLNHISLF